MKIIKRIVLTITMVLSLPTFADQTISNPPPPKPWFTGPLLAPTGTTYTPGHIGYQFYVFYTDDFGHYDHRWKRISEVSTEKWNPVAIVFIGLTSRTDFQLTVPYFVTDRNGASDHGFSDATFLFDYQALKEVPHTWQPYLKLTVGESFPTGKYRNLNPGLRGTDAMGAGSYQTILAATFQKLLYLGNDHFLRGRWNFTYTIPARVSLIGFNSYGGARNTNGTLKVGNHFSTDLAFEYTLTRNWVPAIDFLYTVSAKNIFNGNRGTTSLGLPAMIGTSSREEFSIAPAMEYNFNAKVGIIAGVWFSVTGRNARDFTSGVFSIDLSF